MSLMDQVHRRLEVFGIKLPEDTVKYMTTEVTQLVLNYINQNTLPEGLYPVVAKMVTAVLEPFTRIDTTTGQPKEGIALEDISSLKVGDVTVNLKTGQEAISRSSAVRIAEETLAGVLDDYKNQLNAFRRVKW